MNHAELHAAVRAVAGGKYFSVKVESMEHHPGRIEVVYELYVVGGRIVADHNPAAALERLKWNHGLVEEEPQVNQSLAAIGEAPSTDDVRTDLKAVG